MFRKYAIYNQSLSDLPNTSLLITTINAYSYNVAREDKAFAEALHKSDVLIPDGISVVWATKLLLGHKIKKIAGEDLFYYEMKRLNSGETHGHASQSNHGRAFFLGSTEEVLAKIKARAAVDFPNIEVHTYSPPYKAAFSAEDNAAMVAAINAVNPDVLFVGMTAPKQEKWAHQLMNNEQLIMNNEDNTENELSIINYQLSITNCHVCCIGAVFDFYAGTVKRAPKWVINLGMEWFYRLVSEPKRMWRRYLVGNVKFVWYVLREKFNNK